MRVCQHHTTRSHLNKQSTFLPHSSVVHSAKQEQIEQCLTWLAFYDFQPVETTDKPEPGRQRCHVTIETVYEDLAASFERWSGR